MRRRRIDLIVNLTSPRTVLDRTAIGILNALIVGGEVYTADVRAEVAAAGGDWRRATDAAKALRNCGYLVTVNQHRHLTTWEMSPSEDDALLYLQRIVNDSYSEAVSTGRALTHAVTVDGLPVHAVLVQMQHHAINLGSALDTPKTPAEVLKELESL